MAYSGGAGNRMNHDIIPGIWQPSAQEMECGPVEAPAGGGFAMIKTHPIAETGKHCRHRTSGPGLGLDDNIFLMASFQVPKFHDEQAVQNPVSGGTSGLRFLILHLVCWY